MKYLSIIAFVLFQLSNCFGQIKISSRVIPWKTLDSLDSLKVLLQTRNGEILKSTFSVDEFKHMDGEYPRTIFELNLDEITQNLEVKVSYKYKSCIRGTSDQLVYHEVLNIPINNREERIELEIHFQKYYDEESNVTFKERINNLIAKKIYRLPQEVKLIRDWEPMISNNPKYFIQNNSSYKFYGVSEDGKFEGELFRITNESIKQVNTGGYNLSNVPSKQLYKENYVLSSIRDHRETDNRFKILNRGKYMYRVYLAFHPYENRNRYGETPFYSINHNECSNPFEKNKIYEYFELKDEFEIK